jgi:hypothetical protein
METDLSTVHDSSFRPDPTAPDRTPFFLPSYGLCVPMQIRVDARRMYILHWCFPINGRTFVVLLTRVFTRRFVPKKRETRIEDG